MTETIDNVARAIYMAHWDPGEENKRGPDHRFPPMWDAASESVKEWCRVQARAAVREYLTHFEAHGNA